MGGLEQKRIANLTAHSEQYKDQCAAAVHYLLTTQSSAFILYFFFF